MTARAVLALAGGALAGAVIWSALFLLFGPGGLLAPRAASSDGVPVLRRADAHPDAPARRPLSAADLEDDDDAVFARPVTSASPHRRRSNSRFRRTSTCRSPPSTPARCRLCR
ncbi:hypothetical protein MOP88_08260 [Sphingomonas sp. WKB10]|nr:hypothetical protein [Sphingomonas sp. WKB10]